MKWIMSVAAAALCAAAVRSGGDEEAATRSESFEVNGIQISASDLSHVAVYEGTELVCFFRAKGRHAPAAVLAKGDVSVIRTIRSLVMKQGFLVIEYEKGTTSLNTAAASRVEYSEGELALHYR